MEILFLTPQLPYPPRQGTTLRNYGLITYLARRHTLDLLTFLAPGEELTAENPLHDLCRHIQALPQPLRSIQDRARSTLLSPLPDMALRLEDPAMHRTVQSWLADHSYQILQVEGIEMAQYARHAAGGPAVVFDNHNCEYLLQQRNAMTDLRRPRRWPAAVYSLVQWHKLRRYEAQICGSADAVIAVSEPDRAALQRIAPHAGMAVIPNGIDLAGYRATSVARPQDAPFTLLFTGKMDYRPNVDAVLWFGLEVLPLILHQAPNVRFQVVGQNPHSRLDKLQGIPQIEITGAVPDIQPYLQAADLVVIPMRVGGGTRFKALEAMAAAKPVVSTSLGIEGIGIRPGRDLLLADSPPDFARTVADLVEDAEQGGARAHALGVAARTFVESRYAWERILPELEQIYAKLAPSRPIHPRTEGI